MKSRLAAAGPGLVFAWLVFFATALLFQKLNGAYQCEFGGHPDEAAHYVTGLMIRDYIAAGFPGSPMAYAKEYYDHYPKVALGNWPPVFYLVQSAWTLAFSPSRLAVLMLMAALTSITATLLFAVVRKKIGAWEAWAGALFFIAIPLAQRHSAMIMTEILISLFTLAALIFFARFLEREKASNSLLFGAFASAAILTKGSGLFLGPVPLLAILLMGKWRLLKRPAFWGAAAIVFILCFPWTWKFRDVARAGWMEGNPSSHFTQAALLFYPTKLFLSVGLGLAVCAVVGMISGFLRGKEARSEPAAAKGIDSMAAVFLSALLALICFHSIIPAGLEDRHLVPALPLVIFFAMIGVKRASHFIQAFGITSRTAVLLLLGALLLAFSLQTFRLPPKGYQGFAQAAEAILNEPKNSKARLLVSSDARGEGMCISEVAMREKRPGHFVQRASKVLASSTWSGSGYKMTYKRINQKGKTEEREYRTEEDLAEMLREDIYDLLIVDTSLPDHYRKPHHEMLRKTAEKFPETFARVAEFPIQRENAWTNGIYLYRVKKS